MSNILKGLQLNELSNKKLGDYKTAAGADATAADKEGDYKRGDKRMSGIIKATKKEFANDKKKLKEFAPVGGDDREPDEEEILRQLAAKWYHGDEDPKAERTLEMMGWEIGHVESGDDDAGVFVVRAGDENGNSYIAFNQSDLNLNEVYNNYHANRTGFSRGQRDDERHDLDKPTQVWGLKINGKVWSKGGADVTFTSKQAALNARNAILKNKPDLEIGLVTKGGVAEGEGNFAGDTPVNLGGDTVKRLQVGDIVKYFGQKAKILAMSNTGNTSRITIANDMGGVTKDVLTSDLKRTGLSEEELDENLNKWFKEKWVRFGPDGKIRGDCARGDDSEGKPKCLPQSKAHSLGKKGRASAASRKRREDPNPERSGKAINVNTKKTNEEQLDELSCWSGYHRVAGTKAGFPGSCAKNKTNESEHSESCPHCGGEMVSEELMNEKKDACYYKVKSRYKVWPSAYASGALVKCRKKGADSWGNGGKKNESIEEDQLDEKWTKKYKDSINCSNPKGFSQKAHCAGKQKNESAIMSGLNQLDEGWKEKLGAAALAGSMALGAGAAHSRVTPDGQGGFTGGLKPTATVTAPSDNKPAAEAPKGFSKEYLQKAADPNRTGRYMISVEKAQELLKSMP